MKTQIKEEDGLFILVCNDCGQEVDIFKTNSEALEAQKEAWCC